MEQGRGWKAGATEMGGAEEEGWGGQEEGGRRGRTRALAARTAAARESRVMVQPGRLGC